MFEEKYTDRIESLKKDGYTLHHTATCRGYVSRVGDAYAEEAYDGKFGRGFKILRPNWESTRYCYVEYWVL